MCDIFQSLKPTSFWKELATLWKYNVIISFDLLHTAHSCFLEVARSWHTSCCSAGISANASPLWLWLLLVDLLLLWQIVCAVPGVAGQC